MFQIVKIFNLKLLLRLVLCTQLCLSPYYGYSADSPDNSDNPTEKKSFPLTGESTEQEEEANVRRLLQEQQEELRTEYGDNPRIWKKIEAVNKLAAAIDLGTVNEYLAAHPEVKKEAQNLFLFADQTVESIEYHFDSKTNRFIQQVGETLRFNDSASHPIPVIFNNIKVRYNKKSRELIFEGILQKNIRGTVEEQVVVRHRVPDMDIINYANDREMLAIVDQKKGLLLVDMVFVEAHLSRTPIPFTKVYVPILENLEQKIASDSKKGVVDVEFVNESVRRPDIAPEYMEAMEKTFEGRSFVTAGDLMISYTDSNKQKHLVQFLKRTDMASWLKMEFSVLNMMINTVAPYLMDAEELKRFAEEKRDFQARGDNNEQRESGQKEERILLDYMLSGFFTSESIQKLVQAKGAIKQRSEQLSNLSEREIILYDEWEQNFKKISRRINSLKRNPSKRTDLREAGLSAKVSQSVVERKSIGNVFTTGDIFTLSSKGYPSKEEESKKEIRNKALRWIASKSKPGWEFVKEKKVELGIGAVLFLTAGYFMSKKLTYTDGVAFYTTTTLPHLLIVGTLLPVLFYSMARYYPDAMEKTKIFYDAKIGKMDSWAREFMQKSVERWKDTGYHHRLANWGARIVSFGMLPFWIRITEWMGQPHFFPALQKKLKVFDKISPDSDIGQIVGLKKDTALGISNFQWNRSSKDFVTHEHLQNVAQEKQFRMQSIAWLMATLAVTQAEGVSPAEILIYGVSNFDLDAVIRAQKDAELRSELLWVMKNLYAEIEKKNELDMRKELAELDPKILTTYYEEAKQLAQKFHASPNKKKIRKMVYNITQLIDKTPLGYLRHPRNIATLNMVESDLLRRVPTDFVAERVVLEFLMDHLVVIFMPLVATGRADINLETMTRDMSIYANKFAFTGEAHLQDVWLNVIIHFFLAAGQRSLLFTQSASDIQKIHKKYAGVYEPKGKFLHGIEDKENRIRDEFKSLFSYLKMRGESDASKGYPNNFGDLMWKDWKTRTKMWQIGAILHSSMRWALTEQTWSQIFFSYLIINLAGGAINGWWMWINGAAQLNDAKLIENRERMETLRNKLYKIKQKLHTSEKDLHASYKKVLLEIVDLYRKNGLKRELLKAVETVNPALFSYVNQLSKAVQAEWSILQSKEEITLTAERLLMLISKNPPLPTEKSKFSRSAIAFGLGGIASTIAAVELIIYTFDPNYLNWGTVGVLAASVFSIYIALWWGYKKYDLKWRTYFYERALGLGRGVRNVCRRAFNNPMSARE
ncbi:MAG: hypothetical protein OXM55_07050 [Bdellovibrionales bacterium]|nr:hypothetical protein [Bdellovibrionales bacterium]